MQVSVKVDSRRCAAYLRDVAGKQIPYAGMRAVNNIAFIAQSDEVSALKQHLDRPTPFTQRAYEVIKANKDRRIASVRARAIQGAYLQYEVFGGSRAPKRAAIVIPKEIGLNAYGNMTKGAIKRVLSRKTVFSGKPGRGRAGIYQRVDKGQGLKLLVAYEGGARYDKQLPFFEVAHATVGRVAHGEMHKALGAALVPRR